MAGKKKTLDEIYAGFTAAQRKQMDEAAGRLSGNFGFSPEVDDIVEEVATLKKKKKTKTGLTPTEEERMDKLMNTLIRKGGSETAGGAPRKEKAVPGSKLSAEEKRRLQADVKLAKGGMPTKKKTAAKASSKGGYANCGASVKPAQKAKK